MNNGLKDEDIKIIVEVLKKYPEVESAVFYGSRAMGTFNKGSDIDIALRGKKLTSRICSHIHFELEEDTLLPYFFDITHFHEIKNEKLIEHIEKFGVLFYRKGWIETTLGEIVEVNISSIDKNFKYKEMYYLDTGSITQCKF